MHGPYLVVTIIVGAAFAALMARTYFFPRTADSEAEREAARRAHVKHQIEVAFTSFHGALRQLIGEADGMIKNDRVFPKFSQGIQIKLMEIGAELYAFQIAARVAKDTLDVEADDGVCDGLSWARLFTAGLLRQAEILMAHFRDYVQSDPHFKEIRREMN